MCRIFQQITRASDKTRYILLSNFSNFSLYLSYMSTFKLWCNCLTIQLTKSARELKVIISARTYDILEKIVSECRKKDEII